ncbi:MAG: hypothetical protein ABFD96_05660 [Armatimonadia bacterium]
MKCPFCAEEIMEDAAKCKHCGEWLKADSKPKTESGFFDETRIFGMPRKLFGTILMVIFMVIVFGVGGDDLIQGITNFFQAPIGFK